MSADRFTEILNYVSAMSGDFGEFRQEFKQFRAETNAQFEKVEQRLDKIEGRFDKIENEVQDRVTALGRKQA